MAIEYKKVHTSYKTMAEDVLALITAYNANELSDNEFDSVIKTWTKYCPNLLYEDEAHTVVSYSLSRIIGKKRAVVLSVAFHRRRNRAITAR